jgi:hypothetical protein
MLPRFFRNRQSRTAALALCIGLVGAASMVYYQFGLFMPRVKTVLAAKRLAGPYAFGADIYPIWLTSRDWRQARRDLYSPAITREIQTGLFGRPLDAHIPTDPSTDYRTFAYPAYCDLLFWPASELPFTTFRIVWTALLATLIAAAVFCWTQALSWRVSWIWLVIIVLLTLCSYPELEGLYAGQLGLLVGFLLAASLLAITRERFVLAGFLMAITTIKPQMTLLAIMYLFFWSLSDWRHRSRFSMSFFATMFLLVGASLVVWPHWIPSWLGVIQGYHRYSMPPLASELLGASLGPYGGVALIVIALIAAVAVGWRWRGAATGSYEFWMTLSLLLAVTTIALLPGQSVCDHIILLPGIFLLASCWRSQRSSSIFRTLLAIGLAVLLWPWLSSLALILLRPLLRREVFSSKAVFVLPLRTAVAFPFVVLGLLVLSSRTRQTLNSAATPLR